MLGVSRDQALEGLRALAALTVLYNHIMVDSVGGWTPSAIWCWPTSGPAAVLIFFLLSGFVIGLTNAPDSPPHAVGSFLKKRAVRLVPINFFAVLLGCAVATSLDPLTVLGNLTFLQNYNPYGEITVPVLDENPNLWSLNYEALFYLLFVFIRRGRVPVAAAATLSFFIGVVGWFSSGPFVFLACYAFGFLFWLSGLALAWHSRPASAPANTNWPTWLLLALITWKLQAAFELLMHSPWPRPWFSGPSVRLYHLDFLPVALCLVAAVARRPFSGLALCKTVAVIIPLGGLAVRLGKDLGSFQGDTPLILGLYGLALGLWRWKPSTAAFALFAPLGAISYALYATARPIQIAVFRTGSNLPPTAYGFAACVFATVGIAAGLSWYLEMRLQPAIKAKLG